MSTMIFQAKWVFMTRSVSNQLSCDLNIELQVKKKYI